MASDAFIRVSSASLEPSVVVSLLPNFLVRSESALILMSICYRDRVFPEDASKFRLEYGSSPYDAINLGIQTLAKWLLTHLPDDPRFNSRDGEKRVCSILHLCRYCGNSPSATG